MIDAKDGSRGRVLFVSVVGVIATLVVISAWLGPGGCQANRPTEQVERLPRPGSPLDGALDLRRPAGEVAAAPVVEPPEERPLPPSSEPMVRIRVAALRGQPLEVSIPRGTFQISEVDAATSNALLGSGAGTSLQLKSPITISRDQTGWLLREGTSGAARERRIEHLRPLEVRVLDARGNIDPDASIAFAGSRWPGVMRVHPRSEPAGAMDVVVLVGIERYIPGVLAKELYRNWALETYRAQAIAARSYAVCEAAHWSRRRHFDMVAGEASQAWIGETDNANAQRGAADTRGMLLVADGRVVPAYYSSCCGGSAADAFETVTRNPNHDIPSLALGREERGRRSKCCPQSPTYTWTERVPVDEVARRIAAWGRENGRSDLGNLRGLASIKVDTVTESGRTNTIALVDGTGARMEMSADALRAAINGAFNDPMRSSSGDAAQRRTLKSSNVEVTIEGGMVVFAGRGHGHGVGLCQYGSEAMSRAGRNWQAILDRYYPGATAARCW